VATVLKTILAYNNVASGATATLPHGLNLSGRAVSPDEIQLDDGDFSIVSSDTTDVTVRNNGAALASVNVLCERWHTEERALPPGQTDLTPQPFVPAGSGGNGGAVSEPRITFVYRPGGVASQNVYTDWATMFAAIGNVEGLKTVLVDDSIVSPALIPAGSWDVTDVRIQGINAQLTVLHSSDGAVFTSSRTLPFASLRRINLRHLGVAAPLITLPVGAVLEVDTALLEATVFPLVTSPGAGNVITLENVAVLDASAGSPVIDCAAGLTFLRVGDGSLVGLDSLGGPGAARAVVVSGSATVADQTVLGGAFTVNSNDTFLGLLAMRWQVPPIGTLGGIRGAEHRVDTTAGPVAVALPALIAGSVGLPIVIKKIVAEAVNAISATPAGGDTILGPSSSTTAFASLMFIDNGDGATWSTVAVI
jgi:hypothetical protein